MRTAFRSRIGTGLSLGVVVAFGVPLVLLLVLGWFQYRAETLSRSIAGFGTDLSVFDAIRIDSRYARWKGVLDSFIADPRPETFAAFAAVDTEWQQQVYDLGASATGPELTDALDQAQKAHTDIIQAVDALAETAAFLTDAEDKIIIAQTEGILKKLQTLRGSLKPGLGEQAAFIGEVAARFRDGLIVSLQFVRKPDPVLADKARRDFLWIAENLGQMLPGASTAAQVEDVRKDLSTFYTAFEQIATTAATRTQLQAQLGTPTMVEKIRLVNPLAGSDWSRSLNAVEDGSLDRLFLWMRWLATAGVVVMGLGLVYSLLHIRGSVQKPLEALLSFCTHAYLARRRMPVPATDHRNEIGELARAIQAMLERVHQQYAITDEGPKPVTVTGGEITTALPAEALPAYLVGRLEQLEERARTAGVLATTLTGTVEQRASLATDSAHEAEHSRTRLQDACVALRDIKDTLEQIDGMADHLLGDMRQAATARERLMIRQRNVQMTVMRLSQAVEALHGMADEVNVLAQNTRRTLSGIEGDPRQATVTATLAQLAQQLEETCLFFRLETVTLAEAIRQALPDEVEGLPGDQVVQDAETLRQRTSSCLSTLLDHFSRVQEAAFTIGQQALQMLETSGVFLRVGAEAAILRQHTDDLADDCGNLRRSMLYREPLPVVSVPDAETVAETGAETAIAATVGTDPAAQTPATASSAPDPTAEDASATSAASPEPEPSRTPA